MKKLFIIFLLVVFFCLPTFALSGEEFDDQLLIHFNDFMNADPTDENATKQKIQELCNLIEEYKQNEAFTYSNENNFDYFSKINQIKEISSSYLQGETTLHELVRSLSMFVSEYYKNTTDSYRYIWFLILIILIIVIIISVLLIVFTFLFLQKKRSSLIGESILNAQEQERAKFSYEIHDSVVQDIKAEQLFVQTLSSTIKQTQKNQKTIELLNKIELLDKKIITNLRSIIKNLSLPQFEKVPLQNLIVEFCNETAFINDISCPVFISSAEILENLTPEKKLHVFRIIQESITNAIKHSNSKEVSVLIREDIAQNKLYIYISDDGDGFNTNQVFESKHYGLRAMNSRASLIKAKLSIESEIGEGTMVKLEV